MGQGLSEEVSKRNLVQEANGPQVICEELMFAPPVGKTIEQSDVVWYSHRKLGGIYVLVAPVVDSRTFTLYKLEKPEKPEDSHKLVELLTATLEKNLYERHILAQTDEGFILYTVSTHVRSVHIDLLKKTVSEGVEWERGNSFKANTNPNGHYRVMGSRLIYHSGSSNEPSAIFDALNKKVQEFYWKDILPKCILSSDFKPIPLDDRYMLLLFHKFPETFLLFDSKLLTASSFTLTWPDAPRDWSTSVQTYSVRLSDDTVLIQDRDALYLVNTVLRVGRKAIGTVALKYSSLIRESDTSAICARGFEAIRMRTVSQQIGSSTLASDMLQVFAEHFKTDVTILANETVFLVHEAVLHVRAPKLLALMTDDRNIDLFKYSGPVLSMMLEFIYSGHLTKLNNYTKATVIEESKQFAQEFELIEAEKLCSKYLRKVHDIPPSETSITIKKLMLEEKYAKAEKLAREMIDKEPKDTRGYMFLAACKNKEGKLWESLKFAMEAYELDTHNIPIENFLASLRTAIMASHLHTKGNDHQLQMLHDSQFNAVARAYLSLVNNPQFADITFVLGDKEYPAHLFLLKNLSYFFANLAYMDDGSETRIDIAQLVPGMNEKVLLQLLTFMYTKTDPFLRTSSPEEVQVLCLAAHIFGFSPLKAACEMTLIHKLTKENIEPLYSFAVSHECSRLRLACERSAPQLTSHVEKVGNVFLKSQNPSEQLKKFVVLDGNAKFAADSPDNITLIPASMDRTGSAILAKRFHVESDFCMTWELRHRGLNPRFPINESHVTLKITPKGLPWQSPTADNGNQLLKTYLGRDEKDPSKLRSSILMQTTHASTGPIEFKEPITQLKFELIGVREEGSGSLLLATFITLNDTTKMTTIVRVSASDYKMLITEMERRPYFAVLRANSFRYYSQVQLSDFKLQFFTTASESKEFETNYRAIILSEAQKQAPAVVKFGKAFGSGLV